MVPREQYVAVACQRKFNNSLPSQPSLLLRLAAAQSWSRDHKPGPEVWARVNRITLLHLIEVILGSLPESIV